MISADLLSQPHHDGSAYHVDTLEPQLGDRVHVSVRVPAAARVRRVWARTAPDGEPSFTRARVDRRIGGETWWRCEVETRNPITNYRFLLDGPGGQRWLTAAGVTRHDVPDATDFRLVSYQPPPSWSRDAVVYQIFPDRFARSADADGRSVPGWAVPCDWDDPVVARGRLAGRQLYGGDLDGIRQHLDHIATLGANTIYLTPIFPGSSNHRYDATSFADVDTLLGGEPALHRLSAAVHERGWRLLGDVTTNHCGSAHPWFRSARRSESSPDREMFYFDLAAKHGYETWIGERSLPKFNWASPLLRQRFLDGGLTRWLKPPISLDGWRIDVANMTGRRGADDFTHEVATHIRQVTTSVRPDALLVAEHAFDATADLDRDGWHGTMSYAGFTGPVCAWLRHAEAQPPVLGTPGPARPKSGVDAVATMRAFAAATSWRSLTHSWALLGSHDTARVRTLLVDPAVVEVAAGLLFTMPGVPMVFAGDEIGLGGRLGEESRRPMPWHRRSSWDMTTFDRYRALTALRHAHPALRHGGMRWAYVGDDVLVYLREIHAERLLVLATRATARPVRLPATGLGLEDGANLYGGAPALRPDTAGVVTLPDDGPTFQVWRVS